MIPTIWIIGWAFTVGLCFEDEWKKSYWWRYPLSLLSWPVILGEYVKEIIE